MVMSSNMDFVTGRSAIQKLYQGLVDMGNVKAIKFETVELEEHGDTAYEVAVQIHDVRPRGKDGGCR